MALKFKTRKDLPRCAQCGGMAESRQGRYCWIECENMWTDGKYHTGTPMYDTMEEAEASWRRNCNHEEKEKAQ